MSLIPLLSDLFDSFAHSAAPIVVAGLWQGLVVSTGLALCFKVAPRIPAAQRFLVWATAFATLAALPFAGIALNSFNPSARASEVSAGSPHPWLQLDARWTLVLAGLWLAASVIRATDLLFHALRLPRLWLTATPVDFPAAPHISCAFQICSTQLLERPSVIGFFAPRILIPDWLLPRLSTEELKQIVLHESEHLRRRDDWTNLLQKLCLIIFPLNPALLVIDRRLAKEREMACDEAVVRMTQAPRAYAACLASLAERSLEHRGSRGQVLIPGVHERKEALSLGAWQRRSELVHRVQSILHRKRLLHPIAARALLGAIACGLFVVTLELARCPQLVAFAPVAQPVQLSAEAARGADAVYPANPHRAGLASGFYAMQAKAEMPMTPFLKPSAGRARASLKTSAVGVLRTSSEPGIANAHLRAQGPEQHAVRESGSRAPNEQQQWIFFTSWEQVESAATDEKSAAPAKSLAEKTGTTADYDTGASSAASSGSAPTNASSAARRIRVTQLIFKVLPANSQSSRTAAIPIGDGWIVIQL